MFVEQVAKRGNSAVSLEISKPLLKTYLSEIAFQDLQYFLYIFWSKRFYCTVTLNNFASKGTIVNIHFIYYMHIYIYIYIYTHTYTYIFIYIYAHTHTYSNTHIHTHTYLYTHIYTHRSVCVCVHVCVCACVHK